MAEKDHEQKKNSNALVIAAAIVLIIGGGIGAFAYMSAISKVVYIEKGQVSAPLVDLSPSASGVLKTVFVAEGDVIAPNTVVAQVDTELIKSTSGGLVVTVNKNIGKTVSPGTPVVVTIDPSELRVVGQVQEDKGLTSIHTGDPVSFTVDAFSGKKFVGTVDSVAPTAGSGDVVFSVSDKRQEQNFDIKVNYDAPSHPEIKNGMSAKIWVYKQ